MPEHKCLWDKWHDGYYLELLYESLNCIPTPPKPFEKMRETELNLWLLKIDFEKQLSGTDTKFKINPQSKKERCSSSQSLKTDIINLKLSLEDNSTLTGTAAILKQFGEEFSIPCPQKYNVTPFDKNVNKLDINCARMQYEFVKSVELPRTEMLETEKQMRSTENQLDLSEGNIESDDDSSEDSEANGRGHVNKTVQQKRETFNDFYEQISKKTKEIVHSEDDNSLGNLIEQLLSDVKKTNELTDQYGRTIFTYSVEMKNYVLVKVLLSIGVNPNFKEGCGTTAMTIAVLNNDVNMCKILLKNFAEYEGAFFGSFPSSLLMATKIDLTNIV